MRKIKRFTCWILSFILILCVAPFSVSAKNYDKALEAMEKPYVGYSSIEELNEYVKAKKKLSQFDYYGQQCVSYAWIRAKEKLFASSVNITGGKSSGNGKEVAKNFVSYGFTEENPRQLYAKGNVYYLTAYVDDGGAHIQSNSMVCFEAASNLTDNTEYGHIVFVEEVAVCDGVKYVYYTEGGTGFSSWEVKKMTFEQFYNHGKGYAGTVCFTKVPVEEGAYTLTAQCAPRLRADIDNQRQENETKIHLWEAHGGKTQTFTFIPYPDGSYRIETAYGKCLDVKGGEAVSGTVVQQYERNETLAQKWYLSDAGEGFFYIESALDRTLLLDAMGGEAKNGTGLQIYTTNQTAAQKWKLTPDSAQLENIQVRMGWFTLQNAESGKMLNVWQNGCADGTNLTIWEPDGTSGEAFKANVYQGNIYLVPQCAYSSAINVRGYKGNSNRNVDVWTQTKHDSQLWQIEACNGGFVLRCVEDPDYVLTENGTENGNNVCLKHYRADDKSQIWVTEMFSAQ